VKAKIKYFVNAGVDERHIMMTVKVFDKLKDAKSWVGENINSQSYQKLYRIVRDVSTDGFGEGHQKIIEKNY